MLKTKFKIDVLGNGNYLMPIVKMIASHNEGKSKIDIDVICGYLLAEKAMYPSTNEKVTFLHNGSNPETLSFSDNNGESYYLTITECTFEELAIPNQLEDVINISQQGEQC